MKLLSCTLELAAQQESHPLLMSVHLAPRAWCRPMGLGTPEADIVLTAFAVSASDNRFKFMWAGCLLTAKSSPSDQPRGQGLLDHKAA